ncbi:hypothetical protein EDC04DRAFT_2612225 [Pisolithus marmoratus]|nr:hypothetical protein EDC04DRAFT_2612225 [Pisolithus marmoratus]
MPNKPRLFWMALKLVRLSNGDNWFNLFQGCLCDARISVTVNIIRSHTYAVVSTDLAWSIPFGSDESHHSHKTIVTVDRSMGPVCMLVDGPPMACSLQTIPSLTNSIADHHT